MNGLLEDSLVCSSVARCQAMLLSCGLFSCISQPAYQCSYPRSCFAHLPSTSTLALHIRGLAFAFAFDMSPVRCITSSRFPPLSSNAHDSKVLRTTHHRGKNKNRQLTIRHDDIHERHHALDEPRAPRHRLRRGRGRAPRMRLDDADHRCEHGREDREQRWSR